MFGATFGIKGAIAPIAPLATRLGGPLTFNERAANNIFSGWISLSRYESPTNFDKTFTICLPYSPYLLISSIFLPGIWPVFCLRLIRATYPEGQRQAHFFFVYGDNFLHERGGQQSWC